MKKRDQMNEYYSWILIFSVLALMIVSIHYYSTLSTEGNFISGLRYCLENGGKVDVSSIKGGLTDINCIYPMENRRGIASDGART